MKFALASVLMFVGMSSAFAATKAEVKPFLGEYTLVSTTKSSCNTNIRIVPACEGFVWQKIYSDGRIFDHAKFCAINEGSDRSLTPSSGGHGIFPQLTYSKVTVKLDSKIPRVTKVEAETSVSIGVFSYELATSLTMENENQLLIRTYSISDGETEEQNDGLQCVYMRK